MNTAEIKKPVQLGGAMRMTNEDKELLRRTFKGRFELITLLRKMFLPTFDPNASIHQAIDLWMTISLKDQTPEQQIINITARNLLIQHVESQLQSIELIALTEPESKEEAEVRKTKDSTK